jgi:hypothetical protein
MSETSGKGASETRDHGDVYTRPGAIERVVGYDRGLASAA